MRWAEALEAAKAMPSAAAAMASFMADPSDFRRGQAAAVLLHLLCNLRQRDDSLRQTLQSPPMTAKTPTIRANVLASVVAELVRRGADADGLLRTHTEGAEALRNPYQEVPLDRYVALFEAAAEVVGDPCFGARMGARFLPEDLGPLGVIFVAAPSLRAALNRLSFFLQAWQGGTRAELEAGQETADWIYQIEHPEIRPRRQDAEFTLSATCGFVRALLGPCWAPLEVGFEHSPASGPPDRRALQAIFKAPVLFEQGVNRIVIDPRDLDRPVWGGRQTLAPYLEQHLRDLLGARDHGDSCSGQVSYLIDKRMGRQSLDVGSLAGELGLSRRTLQRRLAVEGSSLRALIREHRLGLVEPVISSGDAPITSIAHSVGYADPTVFSRAFRSWRGRSPRDHRKAHRNDPGPRRSDPGEPGL